LALEVSRVLEVLRRVDDIEGLELRDVLSLDLSWGSAILSSVLPRS
jgi:hypothetical protein